MWTCHTFSVYMRYTYMQLPSFSKYGSGKGSNKSANIGFNLEKKIISMYIINYYFLFILPLQPNEMLQWAIFWMFKASHPLWSLASLL